MYQSFDIYLVIFILIPLTLYNEIKKILECIMLIEQ